MKDESLGEKIAAVKKELDDINKKLSKIKVELNDTSRKTNSRRGALRVAALVAAGCVGARFAAALCVGALFPRAVCLCVCECAAWVRRDAVLGGARAA